MTFSVWLIFFRIIAWSSCIGKTFHLILSERITTFVTENRYVKNEIQKAFLPGINGVVEHNIVMDEIIKDAKEKKKTVHISFYDLEDAFGSVPHNLIFDTLERNNFPTQISEYIKLLYQNTSAIVNTKKFKSNIFSFKRGVIQGDPLSPIIFLMTFNPIIEYLEKEQERFGYSLNGTKIISLPYADDFCSITTNMRSHQKIMNEINRKIETMGMRLKPIKCRTFSIRSGTPTLIHFKIKENKIPSIAEEEQKFLGKVISFSGKSIDNYNLIKENFTKQLKNLDNTKIRNEYKLWIYKNYFLPSKRFLLTVHELTSSYLKMLDTQTFQFVKKWAGLPKCASNTIFTTNVALDIPSITQLYTETHCLNHATTRIKGDKIVNQALNSKLQRESNCKRNKSVAIGVEEFYNSHSDKENQKKQ